MQIKELIVLGKSDATITMILDNLESNECFPSITIINNLELDIEKPFENESFKIEILKELNHELGENVAFFIGGIQSKTKQKIFERFQISKDDFCSITHATSSISKTSKIGFGCLINSLVSVAAHTLIGDFISINRNVSIGHHTTIHDFSTINPGCNIAGNVVINKGVQIGMGTNVIDGITIGENTIVGAGSLVTKDLPANVVAFGSPAKIIKNI